MQIKVMEAEDLSQVEAFYDVMKYSGSIRATDLVLVANDGQELIGAARLCEEEEELVLRGMYIREDYRRSGLGTEMLHGLEQLLGSRRCWCVAFSHLKGFYSQVDFQPADLVEAPRFLRDRLERYRREGMNVRLLVRLRKTTGVSNARPD